MTEFLPPALILLAGAVLIGPLHGHWRAAVVLGAPLLTLWAVWQVPDGVVTTLPFLDYIIEPVEGSPVRRLFATIFALMAFVGGLYAFRQATWYELASGYAYAAGAIGVAVNVRYLPGFKARSSLIFDAVFFVVMAGLFFPLHALLRRRFARGAGQLRALSLRLGDRGCLSLARARGCSPFLRDRLPARDGASALRSEPGDRGPA